MRDNKLFLGRKFNKSAAKFTPPAKVTEHAWVTSFPWCCLIIICVNIMLFDWIIWKKSGRFIRHCGFGFNQIGFWLLWHEYPGPDLSWICHKRLLEFQDVHLEFTLINHSPSLWLRFNLIRIWFFKLHFE